MKINEYWTIKKAAAFLGITKNTLLKWEEMGKVRAYRHRFNNYRLYKPQELQWLKDNVVNFTIPACKIKLDDLV